MSLSNEVVLRPRFKMPLEQSNKSVLKAFKESKQNQNDFVVNCVDDHVFIRFPKEKQHFWSPQLHLEINEVDNDSSELFGLFGPNPTVWTMFMFFHFIVAGIFIGFGVWAYANWTLNTSYLFQMLIMILMIIVWIALYFAGRMGKYKGKNEMHLLYGFMEKVLGN